MNPGAGRRVRGARPRARPGRERAEGVGRTGSAGLARLPSHSERQAADTRGPHN